MNRRLRYLNKCRKQAEKDSFHFAYEQGYFDSTMDYDRGVNKLKHNVTKKR